MADNLPLLFFPNARSVPPIQKDNFPRSSTHFPNKNIQKQRLNTKFNELQSLLQINTNIAGLE